MKKISCFLMAMSLIFLCSCNDIISEKETQPASSTQNQQSSSFPSDEILNSDIVLPQIENETVNSKFPLKNAFSSEHKDFSVLEKIGNQYWGVITDFTAATAPEALINEHTDEVRRLDFPDWNVASGSVCVMNNRYCFEWRNYISGNSESTHSIRLSRLDMQTGELEFVDEKNLTTPFIYLCQIDENRFLSFWNEKAESDYNNEYATLTVAEIYDINGNKKEIIREKFENNSEWLNSKGMLIEKFYVVGNEIVGIGRKNVSGEMKYFLYYYDTNGTFLRAEELKGLSKILAEETPLELIVAGDYIAVRTLESLSYYILKKTDENIELIAKGAYGGLPFDISSDKRYLYFIEKNINDDDTLKNKECPLYILDTASGKLNAVYLSIPLEKPYFVNLDVLSTDEILLVYCEEKHNPMGLNSFIINTSELLEFIG